MSVPSLPPEQAEAVEWLRSPEGMRWSQRQHWQTEDQCAWLELKRSLEHPWIGELLEDALDDVVAVDLGWYDGQGRYCRGPRSLLHPYGKPVE